MLSSVMKKLLFQSIGALNAPSKRGSPDRRSYRDETGPITFTGRMPGPAEQPSPTLGTCNTRCDSALQGGGGRNPHPNSLSFLPRLLVGSAERRRSI